MYKQGYANKATKAVFASLLAASLVVPSGVALAKTSTTDVDDSTITVTGVNANDVVHAYQIFDTDIDANNNLTFTSKVSGLPQDYDTAEKISKATDGRTVANAIASIVVNNSTTSVNATANAQGKATLTLDSGYWLVTVTTDSGNTKVYQTMIVNATPDINDQGEYVTRVLDDAEAKSLDVPAPEKKIIDPDTQGRSTLPMVTLLATSLNSRSAAPCLTIPRTLSEPFTPSPTSRTPVLLSTSPLWLSRMAPPCWRRTRTTPLPGTPTTATPFPLTRTTS